MASYRERLRAAALSLLEKLDVLEARDFESCERAVYLAIRGAADRASLMPVEVWREAVEIEGDPVARHRIHLRSGWKPNLR